jgi:hypothetical protein
MNFHDSLAEIRTSDVFRRHIGRLRASLSAHSQDSVCDFLCEYTRLRGEKFSFKHHEYQERILGDPSIEIVVCKPAQVGLSEASSRLAVARTALSNGFSTIYTLPAASFARNFMKTRIDPVIRGSEYLRELISGDVDNSEIKQFGESFLYVKGAQVDRQAISVPADMLIVDEVNSASQDVITLYESRLNHSSYGYKVKLSTPTIPGYGISTLFDESRQHFNLVKCKHCNHWFYPRYYDHVRIPDFTEDLHTITKAHFSHAEFRWGEAYVACPQCGKEVDLTPAHRQWVVKNPDAAYVAAGYQVSPFDCPHVVKVSALVKASTEYERHRDFMNQRLGEPLEDKESSLVRDELLRLIIDTPPGRGHSIVMGLDLGMTCWCTIAAVLPDQTLVIIYTEGISLRNVRERRRTLSLQYRVRMTVVDSGPYTELVWQMQAEDANLFAAVYVESRNVELFKVKEQDADADEGQAQVKQVNVARNRMFDHVMLQLRTGKILKVTDENNDLWVAHLMDQKRVEEFRREGLVYVWVKTRGEDHLHHSLLYALVASRMLGVASGGLVGIPIVLGKFKTTMDKRSA